MGSHTLVLVLVLLLQGVSFSLSLSFSFSISASTYLLSTCLLTYLHTTKYPFPPPPTSNFKTARPPPVLPGSRRRRETIPAIFFLSFAFFPLLERLKPTQQSLVLSSSSLVFVFFCSPPCTVYSRPAIFQPSRSTLPTRLPRRRSLRIRSLRSAVSVQLQSARSADEYYTTFTYLSCHSIKVLPFSLFPSTRPLAVKIWRWRDACVGNRHRPYRPSIPPPSQSRKGGQGRTTCKGNCSIPPPLGLYLSTTRKTSNKQENKKTHYTISPSKAYPGGLAALTSSTTRIEESCYGSEPALSHQTSSPASSNA